MKGVLLAAGRGTRLQPLTDHCPKPLLEVGGKPILTRIIEGLRDAGIDDLSLIIGHLGDRIRDTYGDGSSLGVTLSYHVQTVRDGTARAVLPAAESLSNEPFFLGYGDILVAPENYTRLTSFHHAHPEDAVLTGWPSDTPWTGGVLVVRNDHDRHILSDLVEKPPRNQLPGNLINAGLMILQPGILDC
nr:nucleotidyltransferase family protein [bacterium]